MKRYQKQFLASLAVMAIAVCSGSVAQAGDGPDSVTLGTLAALYEPVVFDHAMHENVVDGNCAVCHHHTTGKPPVSDRCRKCHATSGPASEVACQACHSPQRFEAQYLKEVEQDATRYHVDKIGLKGAYHALCMDCHAANDAPVGCQDCHARTDDGDRFFHSGSYAPPENAGAAAQGH